jgi:hypothetical protein
MSSPSATSSVGASAIRQRLASGCVNTIVLTRPMRLASGATAAATGAITGAVIVVGARAITDLPTAIIAPVSLGVLWRYKISEPIIVTISGLVGLILWPLVRGG